MNASMKYLPILHGFNVGMSLALFLDGRGPIWLVLSVLWAFAGVVTIETYKTISPHKEGR